MEGGEVEDKQSVVSDALTFWQEGDVCWCDLRCGISPADAFAAVIVSFWQVKIGMLLDDDVPHANVRVPQGP